MGHSLRNTNITIDGSLRIYGDEGEKKILLSNAAGLVRWSYATSSIDTRPEGHYIGELFGGGIVVDVWNYNGIEKCLIAAPENISMLQLSANSATFSYGFSWSSAWAGYYPHGSYDNEYGPIDIGAMSPYFGTINSANISDIYSSSAARRCQNYVNPNLGLGIWEDWFLPSIGELKCLFDNSAIFNKVLSDWSSDNSFLTKDNVRYTTTINSGSTTTSLTGYSASAINLLEFGTPTRYSKITTTINNTVVPVTTTITESIVKSNDYPVYWSSTEWIGVGVLGISTTADYGIGPIVVDPFETSPLCSVRPFRIADDKDKSIVFDAEWVILTYEFSGERDLDTRTTLISPYYDQSQLGFGKISTGGWRPPDITSSLVEDYYTTSSINFIVAHAGDNTGFGLETILININAFKYYFPEESELEIDARAHWYVNNFSNPTWIDTTSTLGITQRERLERTNPTVLSVQMFKGGTASRNPQNLYQWIVSGYSASYSVDSYGKIIDDIYPRPNDPLYDTIDGVHTSNTIEYPSGQRVARLKYNVIGKYGRLITD